MTLREELYGAALTVVRPLLPAAGLAGPKAARASAGRRAAAASLEGWARRGRRRDLPLVWVHGASAGELTGVAPVVRRLRERRSFQLVLTHTSPSAEPFLPSLGPDAADYLPVDRTSECGRVIRALNPDLLLFAKTDVWPNLTRAAAEAGVPLGLVNGTVRPDSRRLRPAARFLLRPAYGRLSLAGACMEGDAGRLERLGVPRGALRVTGDAAADEALRRAEDGTGGTALRRLRELLPDDGLPRVVAGSTWPRDEALLVEALAGPGGGRLPCHLVLVPHEPDPEARARVRGLVREATGREPAVWSGGPGRERGGSEPERVEPGGRVLLVDEVGVLAELYAGADLAYVGGGLGTGGLHSVIEPAAAGVPVLFGPRHRRWEARELLERSGAAEVRPGEAASLLRDLLADPGRRERMGRAARAVAEGAAGGAEAGAELALELLDGG